MGHFCTYDMENLTDDKTKEVYAMYELQNFTRILQEENDNVLQKKSWRIFIITLYSVVIVIGFIKNLVVFTVIVRSKQLHTVTNIFIGTLALSDIMLCVFNLPFQLHYQVTAYWSFGPVLCRVIMPLFAVPIFVSTAAMLMIAIDRYMLIVYPFMSRMTNQMAICIVVSIVILTVCFAIPAIFHMDLHQVDIPEINYHTSQCIEMWSLTEQLMYSMGVFFVQFAIPLVIVAVLYFRIYLVLKNRPNKRNDTQKNQKTNKILMAIVLLFTIFWLPWNLFSLILASKGNVISKTSFRPYIKMTDLLLKIIAMSTACINPYLYGWLNDNFRNGLKNIFHGRHKLKQFKRCNNGITVNNPSRTLDVGLTTAL